MQGVAAVRLGDVKLERLAAEGAAAVDHPVQPRRQGDPAVTRDYWDALPERVRRHLCVDVVDTLTPITQKHTIEGLVMGEA